MGIPEHDRIGASLLPYRTPDFTGRHHLLREIRKFTRDQQQGYLVLVGGMGIGKTSLMAELIGEANESSKRPVFHMVDYHPSTSGKHENIAYSLYQQLIDKYDLEEPKKWGTLPAEERLEEILKHISANRPTWDSKEILFIDAADQAEQDPERPLLPQTLRDLPPGVICIITSRPKTSFLESDATVWQIEDYVNDREDIGAFLHLSGALDAGFVDEIVEQAHPPVFFTARKNLDDLRSSLTSESDKTGLQTTAARWTVPPEKLVRREAARIARTAGSSEVWRDLGLLACAKNELNKDQLDDLGLWNDEIEQILNLAANFFTMLPRTPSEPYRFAHPGYLREVLGRLTGKETQGCHRKLADGCKGWRALEGKSREYALRYLLSHLRVAKLWDAHEQVLSEEDFLRGIFSKDLSAVLAEAIHASATSERPLDSISRSIIEGFNAYELQLLPDLSGGQASRFRHELSRVFGRYQGWPEALRQGFEEARNFPTMLFVGTVHDREGNPEKASAVFRAMVENEKENPESITYCAACVKLATVLDHLGDKLDDKDLLREGLAVLNEALGAPDAELLFQQNYWWGQYHKGIILRKLGQGDEAAGIFESIRNTQGAKEQHRTAALHHLGIIDLEQGIRHRRQGNAEQARQLLLKAEEEFHSCLRERSRSKRNHRRAYEHLRLGQVYAMTDRLEEARSAFARSAEISRRCAHPRYVQKTEEAMADTFLTLHLEKLPRKRFWLRECSHETNFDEDVLVASLNRLSSHKSFGYLEVIDAKSAMPTGELAQWDEVHDEGLLHATVTVLVVDAEDRIALQRRGEESSQDRWDASVTGHVEPGEQDVRAAARETREELGLTVDPERLRRLSNPYEFYKEGSPRIENDLHTSRLHYLYGASRFNREYVSVFLLDVSQQEKARVATASERHALEAEPEVLEVKWHTVSDILDMISESPAGFASGLKHLFCHEDNVAAINGALTRGKASD